jgi:hypothetical protein
MIVSQDAGEGNRPFDIRHGRPRLQGVIFDDDPCSS